jgi:glycosyltransferase involved in cell wall biosynthesis
VHVSAGERLLGEQAGIAASWAHVPNGVDLQRFQPADRTAARGRLGLAGGPLVLCIGRICRQKGQDLLLEAWPEVLGRVPGAALAIVGGMDEDRFATPAAESVMWTGDVDDPGDWYAAADVVAIPSRWEAGAPLVAREAMACGRSVVMSDVPGAREDVPAGAGALPAVGDSSALSVAIADRLLDPLRAQREGECGRAYAESHLSVGLSTQRMAALYERTTDSFA